MKKRITGLVIAVVLVLAFGVGIWVWKEQSAVEDALPAMAMVDDVVYVLYWEAEQIPDTEPAGWLDEIIGNEIPYGNGQVNFGSESVPYWYIENGICVKTSEEYYMIGHELEAQE